MIELLEKDALIREIPLFSDLSAEQRSLIHARSTIVEYKKNTFIYKENDPADAFFCIVLGRAVLYTADKFGKERILEYLHRGKYFGIISLLTGDRHSVTARALNDCLILVIKKEDFDCILKRVPQLAIDLSQTLSRRLKNKDLHQKTIFESTVISVFSSYSQAGKSVYALNLALSLYRETHKTVIILDICPRDKMHTLPERLRLPGDRKVYELGASAPVQDFVTKDASGINVVCFHYNPDDEASIKKLIGAVMFLVNDYHYIVLDLPATMDEFVFSVLNQSDLIHILTSPDTIDLKRTAHLVDRLRDEFHFQESKIKILVNEYKLSRLHYQEEYQILGQSIYATLPKIEFCSSERLIVDDPDCEYSKAVRRIARQLGDCLVGLALGVGVGYGFCHIGVLKVFEEKKIPIDVISGASIGSVVASLWATGKSADEILEITKEFKSQKYVWNLVDLTFPSVGFIKGNRLYAFLKKYLGNKTFQDVRLPLKIVASDIRRKESRVFEKGLLIDAIMASCAMPGVFHPFKLSGDILLDGGIINPLPTEVLFKMGVKKIIAVNVTPSKEDIIREYELMKATLSAKTTAKYPWFDLRRFVQDRLRTNIVDIIFSSIEVMQAEMAQKEAELADIVLHPNTQGLHWLELHRALEFAHRGEEEARRNIDKIIQVVNE
ncbi:MAG TPA: patatin-like phospholipase family protein [Candidatus Omnitrophota bacterium]|nr:patatin-like phospholipase family protein [Candidatus Omnitrophota bacterium]HPT07447.1 patatin-like phospholipase family protein [Candidatus Omnitrophota bacterium]